VKAPVDLIGDLPVPVPFGGGAELQVAASGWTVGNLNLKLNLSTPTIQAVGQAASEVIWQFHREDTPLVGDQTLVQTVVVLKRQSELHYELQPFTTIDPGWRHRPVRLQLDPISATVELPVP
jgi:hypothetical protein